MAEKTKTTKKAKEAPVSCGDKLCPFHGEKPLKMRGRVFQGEVIKMPQGRATIEFERMNYISKYERYEKRKTKIHARLTPCLKDSIKIGDRIEVAETRPISKTMHFVVVKKIVKEDKK